MPVAQPNPNQTATQLIKAKQESITDTQTTDVLNELLTEVAVETEVEPLLPPSDLDQILEQASAGQLVAMRSDFEGAFWGVQAFGGQLFDEEGRVVLNQGGFANWLGWLKKAQDNPNIVLSRNRSDLLQLFTSGKATYYIGSTDDLATLQEALGPEVLGVIRLPGRRDKEAGPFLSVDAMMFNRRSTRRNTQLAVQLAQFLSNTEHQRQLVSSAGKLPANSQVNIDGRIEPIVAEFIAQSKSALSVSLKEFGKFKDVVAKGNTVYAQALGGEIGVAEAVTLLTTEINEQYGLETVLIDPLEDCDVAGSITLWNTWTGASRDVLSDMENRFTNACPQASITIVDVESAELETRYSEAFDTDEAPDLLTGDNDLIRHLVNQEQLLNLSDFLDPEFLQQFIPLVEQSVLSGDKVYGIPVRLNTMALYYNRDIVADPPASLDDLLIVASIDTPVGIPIGFRESYWGISAFGESSSAELLDQEGRLIVGQSGLVEWLAWLAQEASAQPGIVLDSNQAELENLFLEEDVALLISDATALESIQSTFGAEELGILPLPSGKPLLEVESLLFNPLSSDEKRDVALKFAQFMSHLDTQTLLMEQANRVPTNINVVTSDYPAISAFIEQANNATLIPNVPQVEAVFEWGDSVYEDVLENGVEPATAVNDFTTVVDVSNGFEIEVAEATEEAECVEEGEVTLWHSWSELEEATWEELITNFAERCPNIEVKPTFVEADDFSQELAATLENSDAESIPHLFIASHADLETYEAEVLIQDIGQVVDETTRLSYLPHTIEGLSNGDELYGLPQALHLPALYYHPSLVETPAGSFATLLEQAEQGSKMAMNTEFVDLFWGAAAFGCEPCQADELFDEQGELALSEGDFTAWLAWLAEAKATNNVIFDSDQSALEELFLAGEVDYLVADVSFLNQAQAELGIADVGVAPLPAGAEEQASVPFLTVDSFFFHSQATEEEVELALKFATFASSQASQTLLMEKANVVPTNDLAIITADGADIAPFIAEINASITLPQQSKRDLITESKLDEIYNDLAQ